MRGKVLQRDCPLVSWRITPAYAGKRTVRSGQPLPDQDHPRVCGEKLPISCPGKFDIGSPPRMRGKVCCSLATLARSGITPAYAGKSSALLPPYLLTRDHPRVCGEKAQVVHGCGAYSGSPPRMRGKAIFPACTLGRIGITPAYAGKRRW